MKHKHDYSSGGGDDDDDDDEDCFDEKILIWPLKRLSRYEYSRTSK